MNTVLVPQEAVYSGDLILVNPRLPVRRNPAALVPVGADVFLEETAAQALNRLMDGLDGWESIAPVSGWRSMEEQRQIYDQSMEENGREFTEKFVALPGCSEHQTGLAIDLGLAQGEIDFIRPDFPYTGICQEFRRCAPEYGFIERYPAGKEGVTGIAHEPWHFRYVGVPHAAMMAERNLTLEEYHEWLKPFSGNEHALCWQSGKRQYRIFWQKAGQALRLPGDASCQLSGDNEDGVIVTLKI